MCSQLFSAIGTSGGQRRTDGFSILSHRCAWLISMVSSSRLDGIHSINQLCYLDICAVEFALECLLLLSS